MTTPRSRCGSSRPGRGQKDPGGPGGWLVFDDESGQPVRPPRSRAWARRGHTPVIRVRGGAGRVPVAALACCRPGFRTRLIYRLHLYRGRRGGVKAFTWDEYRGLRIAARQQLPGGVIVVIWDNLPVHLRKELRVFTAARPWLRVYSCLLMPLT